MKERFKRIWNDSVGSSIISAIIFAVLSLIWVAVVSITKDENFWEKLLIFLNTKIALKYLIGLVIIILSVFVAIKNFRKPRIKYTEDHQILDLNLFIKIRDEYLPVNRSISFLRHATFAGGAFSRKYIYDLEDLFYKFKDPYLEFVDPELNEQLDKLKKYIRTFLEELAENTWSVGTPSDEILSVPKEWQHEQYDRFKSVTDSLHLKADIICDTYDIIIRLGKIKFGV